MSTSARVLSLHGVATNVDHRLFSFRNMCEENDLGRFLRAAAPFVPLANALTGKGIGLTIDDATGGAAAAAMLARNLGHAVTLFVNPEQVELGTPHSFLVMHLMLDTLGGRPVSLWGERYPSRSKANRQQLHSAIKTRLRAIVDERARLAMLSDLGAEWGTARFTVPPHLRTLTRDDLIALRDAGVDIQNHGWSHTSHRDLSAQDSAREIASGRAWLQRELRVDAPLFAVPFGDDLPHPSVSADCTTWFSLHPALASGWLAPDVFNRDVLDVTPPRSSWRRWWERRFH
ncbi:MAG: polysaccharide deacetylase family protein [Gemmatimonadota bacterium]